MKHPLRFVTIGILVLLAFAQAAIADGPIVRRGPDALHYVVRNNVTPIEFGTDYIHGFFQIRYIKRGEKVQETLTLQVSGLETNATNSLTAGIGDDPANVHTVAHLPTDRRGRWNVTMMTKTPAPVRPGRRPPIPEMLSPLTQLGAICIENSSGQLIANGGVFDAYRFQYLIKRNLTPVDPEGTAAGWMTLTANERRAILVVAAGGLEPSTEYALELNSEVVGAVITNARGYFKFRVWPESAPPVLQLRSLAIVGPSGPVLTTTFPR